MLSAILAAGVLAFAADYAAVKVGAGFTAPTNIASARDGSGRLFVSEHGGTVRILTPTGEVQPFLDITDRVYQRSTFCCDEQGLLSVTFPPGAGAKDHFFVSYVDRKSNIVVSRFDIPAGAGLADASSEVILQKLLHTDINHFGGSLAFHPIDGLLYWSIGDGSSGDNVAHSQVPGDPLGKVLRFDPYAGPNSKLEVYAMGFRNPWRMAFDSKNGDLYIGDVGENTYEEINYVPGGSPAGKYNFGWGIMEGFFCYENSPCVADGLTLPIVAFDHDAGCSATGGEVYRGGKHPDWEGKYFYADFCLGNAWETHREDTEWVVNKVLDRSDNAISSFGRGEDGEIYFVNYVKGTVFMLDTASPAPRMPLRKR